MNYVMSIIAPERLEILTDLCEGLGLPLTVTLHGRGTAVQSMLDLLGIESNERRVVLTIADAEKTAALIAAQKRRLHIGVPGHGIVIAVPIKSVGGGNTVAYLNGGRSPKYTPDLSCAYELIIAIANEGGTDAVMNAARAAGARGGTVLHGKGTGAKGAPKFYNISIAAEKEVILIVSAAGRVSAVSCSGMENGTVVWPAAFGQNVVLRRRSHCMRPRSSTASARPVPKGFASASSAPFSQMRSCAAKTISVVDSPCPASA